MSSARKDVSLLGAGPYADEPVETEDYLKAYLPLVHGIVRRRIPERDVDDVSKDVIIGGWKWTQEHPKRTRSAERAVVIRIAQRRIADFYRQPWNKNVFLMEDLTAVETAKGLLASDGNPETAFLKAAEQREVFQRVSRLPTEQQLALLFFHVDGLSYREISVLLQKSVGAVGNLLLRAMTTLRQR